MAYFCPDCGELLFYKEHYLGMDNFFVCILTQGCDFICDKDLEHKLDNVEDPKKEGISKAIVEYNRMVNDPDYGLMDYNNWCMDESLDKNSLMVKAKWCAETASAKTKNSYMYSGIYAQAVIRHAKTLRARKDIW